MSDWACVGLMALFFLVAAGFVILCDRTREVEK